MPWWVWALSLALGCAAIGFAVYWAIGSGALWEGLARAAKRGAVALWKLLAPKLLKPASPEELARRKAIRDRGGDDSPSGRPFHRQKGE